MFNASQYHKMQDIRLEVLHAYGKAVHLTFTASNHNFEYEVAYFANTGILQFIAVTHSDCVPDIQEFAIRLTLPILGPGGHEVVTP
jgi:hypothetical protein